MLHSEINLICFVINFFFFIVFIVHLFNSRKLNGKTTCQRKYKTYLKVWVEAEQEGFSCAIAVFTDSEWVRRKSSKHLKSTRHQVMKGRSIH